VRPSLAALLRSDQLGVSCLERTGRRGTLQPVRTRHLRWGPRASNQAGSGVSSISCQLGAASQ
jgi:hypothetical protein